MQGKVTPLEYKAHLSNTLPPKKLDALPDFSSQGTVDLFDT